MQGLEEIEDVALSVILAGDFELLSCFGRADWSGSIRHFTLLSEHETGDQLLEYLDEFDVSDVWLPNLQTLSVQGTSPPTREALNKWSKADFLNPTVQQHLLEQAEAL